MLDEAFALTYRQRVAAALSDDARLWKTPIIVKRMGRRRALAYVDQFQSSPSGVAVFLNANLREHADDFVHTMTEEAVHVVQILTGATFDFDPPYAKRPHEVAAKQLAEDLIGFVRPELPVIYVQHSRFSSPQ